MRRLAAAVWSGGWLAAMLAGPPWALAAAFGWPFPRHPPLPPYLREWIASAAVLLLWAMWLVLLALLGLQVRAAVRRIRMPQLRLVDPPEGVLSGLVGAVVLAYTTTASRGAAPAPPPPVADVATWPPAVPAGTPAGPAPQAATPNIPTADAGGEPAGPAATGPPTHGAAPGDRAFPGGPAWAAVVDPAPAAAKAGGERVPGTNPNAADAGLGPRHPNGHGGVAHPGGDVDLGERGGVELPAGGWVSSDTATAVTAAAGLLWLRRRRRYLPGPPSGSDRNDADLEGLPDTTAAVLDAQQNPDLRDPTAPDRDDELGEGPDRRGDGQPGDGGAAREPAVAALANVTAAALGHHRDGPLRPADLPACGVGLTGAGAADAARGILTAVLLAGGPGHPDQDAQVLTTTADLRTLLRPGPVGHGRPPGLNVFTDLAQMLPVLETQVLARDRALAAHPDPDPTTPGNGPALLGPFPPLLVLTTAPAERDLARRLAVLLLSPRPLGITGALLGRWRHGPTWRVDPDGATQLHGQPAVTDLWRWTSAGARLCVLPAAAATDLLTLQAQARPRRHHLHHPAPQTLRVPLPPGPGGPGRRTAAGPAATPPYAGADRPLQLRLFGGVCLFHVREPGTPLRLGRSTAVQVLLYLAVHPHGAASGQIAAALWPGVRPHPVDRVYAAASALRAAVHRATGLHILTRVGGRYRLNPDYLHVDLWQLHTAADHAAAAPHPSGATAALRTIIDTYTGELAAGQPAARLAPHREAARRHAVDAYTTLADLSGPATAAALLDTALQVDLYNEHLHHAAARAHRANGHPERGQPLLTGLTRRLADIGDDPPTPDTTSQPD